MFAKSYKLKSNNTLKNTEKKHLAKRIQDEFPQATEEKVKEIVSVKSTCICMKLVLQSGELVNVYAVDGVPMILEMEQGLAPTVCALWKVPDLVPTLTIHSPVLSKIQGGAPLYLPGVELPAGGIGFPLFQRGTIIAACTTDNSAAGLIGRSTMSSADMLLRAAGVCLDTLHVVGDLLCKDGKFSKIERPKMPPPVYSDIADTITAEVGQLSIQKPREEWPSLGKQERQPTPTSTPTPGPAPNEPRLITDNMETNDEDTPTTGEDMITEDGEAEDEIPTEMDALLRWCLLSFLKLEGKNIELPLRSSLLYRNHLIPLCPSDRTLEVKKSSYKKMSKFLEAMQQEGFIEVREIDKGVEALVAAHAAHGAVRAHRVSGAMRARVAAAPPGGPTAAGPDYSPPLVREMYCVTAHVHDLFAPTKKGTALTPSEVRTGVSEYVRAHSLTSPHSKGAVLLNPTLAKITGKKENEVIRWEELIPTVQGAMTASTEMRFADGSVRLSKARLELVHMQVANRSGNKKVTLVSNLESFGFSLSELAHACQVGVAASCGVTRLPAAKADQLMLQGDQTHFVAKLLIEKYGLPKKFVEGADKALNKKK